jgi:hypothetical protein
MRYQGSVSVGARNAHSKKASYQSEKVGSGRRSGLHRAEYSGKVVPALIVAKVVRAQRPTGKRVVEQHACVTLAVAHRVGR